MSVYLFNNPLNPFDTKFQSPNQAVAMLKPHVAVMCEALSIKPLQFPKEKFDIFLFAGRRKEFFEHVVLDNEVLNFSLPSKSYRSFEYSMVKGKTLESKFCFNASNSTEVSLNWRSLTAWQYYENVFKKYRVNPGVLNCSSLTINGTSSAAKKLHLVFANPGTTNVSAVVRNKFYKSSLNERGSFKKCYNATTCTLPFKPDYYVFIVSNVTNPSSLSNTEVYCVARKTSIALFVFVVAASFVLYIVLMKFYIVGGCYKCVKRWYGPMISDDEVRKKFMEL